MKFRKKPVEIEAVLWNTFGDHEVVKESAAFDGVCKECGKPLIKHGLCPTLEGQHIVCPGDWIITGVKGENYPCKPDIFDITYELVEGKYIGCADPKNTQDDDDCYCNECSMGKNPDECESFRKENKLTLIY